MFCSLEGNVIIVRIPIAVGFWDSDISSFASPSHPATALRLSSVLIIPAAVQTREQPDLILI